MSDSAPTQVDKDGQTLVHTTAPEHRKRKRRIVRPRPVEPAEDATAEGASTDEPSDSAPPVVDDPMQRIIDRHSARTETIAEVASSDDAPAEPEPSDPPPEVEFINEQGESLDVPPPSMEPRASRRLEPSVGDVEVDFDEPTDKIVRSLEDLSGIDFASGQYYVRVERKDPKVSNTRRVDGLQKDITRRMDKTEFARVYGGHRYECMLYGPPKRGPHFDSEDKPIFRPRSNLFTVTVPGRPPNPRMCIGFDADEDDDMMQDTYNRPRPGVATTADARIHETNLEHERHMEERREARRKEREVEARNAARERVREEGTTAQAFAEMHRASIENQASGFRAVTEMQAETIRALQSGRPGAGAEEQRYLSESLQKLQSTHSDYVNRLNENHQAAIDRINQDHRDELRRLDDQHRAEITRLGEQLNAERTRLQDQLNAERSRGDEIVRNAERNLNDRLRENEARVTKEIADARRDATERVDNARSDFTQRLADANQRHADRHTDLKENHERDLRSRDGKWEMQLASERSSFDSKMAVKDHEIKNLRDECQRLRAENAKPIHERVREITQTAEALGMRRAEDVEGGGDAPESWQQLIFRMSGDLIQNLPAIVSSAGETISKLRTGGSPAQQAAYVQQQQAQMAQAAMSHPAARRMAPPPFAIEGENDFQAFAPPMVQAPIVAEPPPAMAPPPAPMPSEPAPMVTAPVQPSAPPPPAAAPSAPPPAPAAPAPAPDSAIDPYVLKYSGAFEQAMSINATPRELAEHLLKTFSPAAIGPALQVLGPESIRAVLQRNGKATSILCRRDGQKYLRAVKAELEALVKAAS